MNHALASSRVISKVSKTRIKKGAVYGYQCQRQLVISRKTAPPPTSPLSRAEYHSLVTYSSMVVVEWPEILTAMETADYGPEMRNHLVPDYCLKDFTGHREEGERPIVDEVGLYGATSLYVRTM